jgi:hypothetical protein
MLVAIQGFGSIWERRTAKPATDSTHVGCAAYYNTTGVTVNGRLRYRWRIGGKIRFNSSGGFNPNDPSRALNRIFECEPPEPRPGGWAQMLFKNVVKDASRPDVYLMAISAEQIGHFDISSPFWKAENVQVLSFSQDNDQQEALLLMPAFSWIRGKAGTFFVERLVRRPWMAALTIGRTV